MSSESLSIGCPQNVFLILIDKALLQPDFSDNDYKYHEGERRGVGVHSNFLKT